MAEDDFSLLTGGSQATGLGGTTDDDTVDFSQFSINRQEEVEQDIDFSKFAGNRSRGEASVNLRSAIDQNPDDYVKAEQLSEESGLPIQAVQSEMREVETRVRSEASANQLVGHPSTSKFLSVARNAIAAQDSVGELTAIEAVANSVKRGVTRVEAGIDLFIAEEATEQEADTKRSFTEILQDEAGYDERFGGYPGLFPSPSDMFLATERWATSRLLGGASETAIARYQSTGEAMRRIENTPMSAPATRFKDGVIEAEGFLGKIEAAASDLPGLLAFSAEVGIEALPQLLAGTTATVATRNPAVGAIVAGLASGLTERYASPQEFLQDLGIDLTDREQVEQLIMDDALVSAAENYGFTRANIIGAVDALSGGFASKALAENPVLDLTLQTAAQMGFGGGGEATAQYVTKGEIDLNEVIFEAVGELATTPVEVAGIGGRYVMSRSQTRDRAKAAQAEANGEVLQSTSDTLQASPLTERSPDQAADHVSQSFGDAGVTEVFVPVEALDAVAQTLDDPVAFYESLGVSTQLSDARLFNGDVRIRMKEYSLNVLQDQEVFAVLKDHTRMTEDALTISESNEAQESVEVSRDTFSSVDTEEDAAVALAEHEAGMQALFNTADEAGFTEVQYASYLEAIARASDASRKRKERARLKRELQKNSEQYKSARETVRQEAEQSVSQEPSYQALLSIGRDRLDYNETLELVGGDVETLKALPKANGRRIYAPKEQKGISPSVIADLNGIEAADIMLFQWLDNPSFEEAVDALTNQRMEEKFPTLISERKNIEEALEALHNDSFGEVIAFELARLRQARGKKKIKTSLVKAKAKRLVESFNISSINIRNLENIQRREATRARRAVRSGDLEAAATAKLNQLVAFHMTKEAYKLRSEVARGNKFMKKFLNKRKKFKNLPVDSLEAIRTALVGYNLGGKLSKAKRDFLRKFVSEARAQGIPVSAEEATLAADGRKNFQDMTLSEWRDLRDTVRSIYKNGLEEDNLRRADEKQKVSDIVSKISENINENIKGINFDVAGDVSQVTEVSRFQTMINNLKKTKSNLSTGIASLLLNINTILRAVDGFESFGPAHTYIKGAIDKAMNDGYLPGQGGYKNRQKVEGEALVRLFDMYSKTERLAMTKQRDIPGVRKRLTHLEQIAVILNLGNSDNIQALLDSKEFTEQELQSIIDNTDKKDFEFAQGVWDYFESFWPEIKDTVQRRQNRIPEKVEASQIETPHGTYRGGYYPLRYDNTKSIVEGYVTVDEAKERMLFGGFVDGQTKSTHTKTRKGSGGRIVKLDPFVINNHIQELIYDLEVGDAVSDVYKVLHNKDMKKAFSDAGAIDVWEALDIWLGDVTTGEIHRGGVVESSLRHIRAGTTISALAFNVSVALLQPLGLLQSSVALGDGKLGKGQARIADAVYTMLRPSTFKGGDARNILEYVTDQSGFMREREATFHKDITEAQKGLAEGWLSKITPGKTAQHVGDAFFLLIRKSQRLVDVATWIAAKKKGMEMFDGNDAKAVKYADDTVRRAQGSGIFSDRTAFERGTINKSIRQTEMVRAFSLFLNYFAAKLSLTYERTANTKFTDPVQTAAWATDMVLLYFVEGLIAYTLKNGLPDDEDDEESLIGVAANEGFKTFTAGLPIVREVVSAAQGFATGGAIGSFISKVAKLEQQVEQGEVDEAALKSLNNVLGVLFRYPSSQINKTGAALFDLAEEEDVDALDFLMGPEYKK